MSVNGSTEVKNFSEYSFYELQEIAATSEDCWKRVDAFLKTFWEELKKKSPQGTIPFGQIIEQVENQLKDVSFQNLFYAFFKVIEKSYWPHVLRKGSFCMSYEGLKYLQSAAAVYEIHVNHVRRTGDSCDPF